MTISSHTPPHDVHGDDTVYELELQLRGPECREFSEADWVAYTTRFDIHVANAMAQVRSSGEFAELTLIGPTTTTLSGTGSIKATFEVTGRPNEDKVPAISAIFKHVEQALTQDEIGWHPFDLHIHAVIGLISLLHSPNAKQAA